jgi:hypothetical protein
LGVFIIIISAIILLFVKVETNNDSKQNEQALINQTDNINDSAYEIQNNINITKDNEKDNANDTYEPDIIDRMSKTKKRIVGTFLSFFAGIMYGFSYMPGLYVQDNYENSSKNNNDYAFSMSTGIFLSSTFYFLIYCFYKKNKPVMNPEIGKTNKTKIKTPCFQNDFN